MPSHNLSARAILGDQGTIAAAGLGDDRGVIVRSLQHARILQLPRLNTGIGVGGTGLINQSNMTIATLVGCDRVAKTNLAHIQQLIGAELEGADLVEVAAKVVLRHPDLAVGGLLGCVDRVVVAGLLDEKIEPEAVLRTRDPHVAAILANVCQIVGSAGVRLFDVSDDIRSSRALIEVSEVVGAGRGAARRGLVQANELTPTCTALEGDHAVRACGVSAVLIQNDVAASAGLADIVPETGQVAGRSTVVILRLKPAVSNRRALGGASAVVIAELTVGNAVAVARLVEPERIARAGLVGVYHGTVDICLSDDVPIAGLPDHEGVARSAGGIILKNDLTGIQSCTIGAARLIDIQGVPVTLLKRIRAIRLSESAGRECKRGDAHGKGKKMLLHD